MSELFWKIFCNKKLNASFAFESDARDYLALMEENYPDYEWIIEEAE